MLQGGGSGQCPVTKGENQRWIHTFAKIDQLDFIKILINRFGCVNKILRHTHIERRAINPRDRPRLRRADFFENDIQGLVLQVGQSKKHVSGMDI